MHYPNAGEASVSFGCGLEKINNYDIKHKCNTESGSSGGPILNELNNKVIGFHKGCIKKFGENKYNIGTFLKFPLIEMNTNFDDSFILLKQIPNDYNYLFHYIMVSDYCYECYECYDMMVNFVKINELKSDIDFIHFFSKTKIKYIKFI